MRENISCICKIRYNPAKVIVNCCGYYIMSLNLPTWLPSVISILQDWLPIIISALLFLILPLRLLLTKQGRRKKDNFVFWFLLAINTSLTIKLFVEQADVILLSVLVLTTFWLILTLKVNSDKENERQTLKKLKEILENVPTITNSGSDDSGKQEAQNKPEKPEEILENVRTIVNSISDNGKRDKVDWQSTLVFVAILINNAILFWKLLLSMEPQAGILITIAIMAGLLLLTLRVDSLEFQKEFPFLTFSKVQ